MAKNMKQAVTIFLGNGKYRTVDRHVTGARPTGVTGATWAGTELEQLSGNVRYAGDVHQVFAWRLPGHTEVYIGWSNDRG